MTSMQYLKAEFGPDFADLSAWLCVGLGNLTAGEMDLAGIVAAVPKHSLMSVLEDVKRCLLAL